MYSEACQPRAPAAWTRETGRSVTSKVFQTRAGTGLRLYQSLFRISRSSTAASSEYVERTSGETSQIALASVFMLSLRQKCLSTKQTASGRAEAVCKTKGAV